MFRVRLEAGSATDEMYTQLHDKHNMRTKLEHIGKFEQAGAKKLRELTSDAVSAAAERLNNRKGMWRHARRKHSTRYDVGYKRQSRGYTKSDVLYPRGR